MLINYLYLGALKCFLCAIQRQHTRKTNLISAIDDQTFYTYFSSILEYFLFHSKSSFICVTLCLRLESNKSPNKIKREQGKSVSRPILASFLRNQLTCNNSNMVGCRLICFLLISPRNTKWFINNRNRDLVSDPNQCIIFI